MKILFIIKTYHDSDKYFENKMSIFNNKTYLEINKIFCDYYLNWLSEFYIHLRKEFNTNIIFINTIELIKNITSEKTKKEYLEYFNYLLQEFNPDIIVSNLENINFLSQVRSDTSYKILWKSSKCGLQDDIFSKNYFQHIISDNDLILKMSKKKQIKNSFLLSSVPDRLLLKDDFFNKKNTIFFTGSLGFDYKYRKEIIKYIIKNDIEIEIRSRDIKDFNKYINRILNTFNLSKYFKKDKHLSSISKKPFFGQELYDYSRKFMYAFNSHSDFDINNAINMRVFETLSLNCLLFTDKNSVLEKYFQDKKHLVIYKNKDDLITKIKKYKNDKQLSSWIANNALDLIKANHTTTKRIDTFKKIIQI